MSLACNDLQKVKVCTQCMVEKPETSEFFSPNPAYKNGLNSWCRECRRANKRRYRAERPEVYRRYKNEHRDEQNAKERERYYADLEGSRSRARSRTKAYRERDPVRAVIQKRLHRYGLTQTKYEDMVRRQGGACAVCGHVPQLGEGDENLHIDHCHVSGKVRGLLCRHCNLAIGWARDSVDRLRALANYLEREKE